MNQTVSPGPRTGSVRISKGQQIISYNQFLNLYIRFKTVCIVSLVIGIINA